MRFVAAVTSLGYSDLWVFSGYCKEDDTGGLFEEYRLEDRGQLESNQPVNLDEATVLGYKMYEILDGQAGQWELSPGLVCVFQHFKGEKTDVPRVFYE